MIFAAWEIHIPAAIEAMKAGKNALCICTISDHLVTGEVTTPEERQNTFTTMMKIALETAVQFAD